MKVFKEQQMQLSQHRELRVLRQQIFDNLGYRYTASRTLGHVRQVMVVVPFSKANFRGLFLQQVSLPVCQELLEEKPLENCFGGRAITVPAENMGEVDAILGDNWDVRTFDTNTVCRVVRAEGLRISWGYKKREMFSHRDCPRCNWAEDSGDARPEVCSPAVSYMVGEPELHFTFTRRRGHWVTGLM
ncbi:Hypp5845 [Branchiostoma lanceolatum]|uniref:Hypp5845 protein n=2 Tax=Branchiostoma lanceolatum TaxID=7740 RepID=A0A8J9YRV5_BRALA|nr:Hypp5845 [Branchiostoma lanceolatum]